jgi:L-histidine N-alpha-methyltransferase
MGDMNDADLVEIGSGANWKIKILFEAVDEEQRRTLRYVPIDFCKEELEHAADGLLEVYPELSVLGLVGDFTKHMCRIPDDRQRLFLFLGSTIGNFNDRESDNFLKHVAESMDKKDRFLIGFDMVKPVEIMERAYDDAKGVTAAFNKNILRVINMELNAGFDPNKFRHLAFYNSEHERIEMHLEALEDMEVEITGLGEKVPFRKGETIRTEICRKFTPEKIRSATSQAGFTIRNWYKDEDDMFSLVELTLQ